MSTLNVPIKIKRGIGVPANGSLKRGELAYSEDLNKLYIGTGNEVGGFAPTVEELLTPATVLEDLADVVFTSGPNDGDVLTYDASEGEWIAQAVAAASVAWDDVTSKPSTFAPATHASSHHTGGADAITAANIGAAAASHTHAASDITSGLATVATTGAYSDLSGTPTLGTAAASASGDFAAASHTHGNISDDGKIGTTADQLVKTGSGGTLTTLGIGTTDQYLRTGASGPEWAALPATSTPSAHSHTIKQELSGFIESPEAKTYVLSPSTHAAMTITQLKAQTSVGTVDIALEDDGDAVTGASLADAGTTLASLASDISVVVAAGSKLTLVVSDPQSSPENLAFTVHYTVASENNS